MAVKLKDQSDDSLTKSSNVIPLRLDKKRSLSKAIADSMRGSSPNIGIVGVFPISYGNNTADIGIKKLEAKVPTKVVEEILDWLKSEEKEIDDSKRYRKGSSEPFEYKIKWGDYFFRRYIDLKNKVCNVKISEAVETPANDDVLCQDINKGLSLWLEAYSGIGMNKNRPVSPYNPAKHSVLADISYYHKVKLCLASQTSREVREKLGRPAYKVQKHYWKQSKSKRPRHPVAGWYGLRSPTLVELLVESYRQGNTLSLCAERKWRRPPPKSQTKQTWEDISVTGAEFATVESYNKPTPIYINNWGNDRDYGALQQKLREMSLRGEQTNTHYYDYLWTTGYFKCTPLTEDQIERSRYERTLFDFDYLNPHIDYLPEVLYSEDLSTPKRSVFYGSRYRGTLAGVHAPRSRFFKRTSVYGDIQWRKYICYYMRYDQGDIDLEHLIAAGKALWEDNNSSVTFPAKYKKVASAPPEETYPGMLLLSSPEAMAKSIATGNSEMAEKFIKKYVPNNAHVFNQDAEDLAVREVLDYKHKSGHSHDNIANFVIASNWKRIPNMLVEVPESYSFEKGYVVAPTELIIPPSNNNKLPQLKTG